MYSMLCPNSLLPSSDLIWKASWFCWIGVLFENHCADTFTPIALLVLCCVLLLCGMPQSPSQPAEIAPA